MKKNKASNEVRRNINYQLAVVCVDDSKPMFKPNDWVKNGETYLVDGIVCSLDDNNVINFIVSDKQGDRLVPHNQIPAIKSERFSMHNVIGPIFLN